MNTHFEKRTKCLLLTNDLMVFLEISYLLLNSLSISLLSLPVFSFPKYTGRDRSSQDKKKTIWACQYLKAKPVMLYSFAVFIIGFPSVFWKLFTVLPQQTAFQSHFGHFFPALNKSDTDQFYCFKLMTQKTLSVICARRWGSSFWNKNWPKNASPFSVSTGQWSAILDTHFTDLNPIKEQTLW